MSERRSLLEGLKQTPSALDPTLEQQFVYADKKPIVEVPVVTPVIPKVHQPARSPFSTRIRSDYALALKRASLERQLAGEEPSSLQDILEAAIEPWLKSQGYL